MKTTTWKLWQILVLVVLLIALSISMGAVAGMTNAKAKADSASNRVVTSEHFALAITTDPQEYLDIREEIRENNYIVLNEAIIRLNADQIAYIIEWELEKDPFGEQADWWNSDDFEDPVLGDGDGIPSVPNQDGVPPIGDGDGIPSVPNQDGVPPIGDGDGIPRVPSQDGIPTIGDGDGIPKAPKAEELKFLCLCYLSYKILHKIDFSLKK